MSLKGWRPRKLKVNPMLGTSPEARALQAAHARRVKAMKRDLQAWKDAEAAGKPRPPRAP
jgi:hypothetical protein